MAKQVYINLPVEDLEKSTKFYQALGFKKNDTFSNDKASGMEWSNEIIVMLVTHGFYKTFIPGKQIIDGSTTSGALLALNFESKEAVQKFADTAKANGGEYFKVDYGMSEDMMFGYEVLDLDGNQWEPIWMSTNFTPQS
jgi:hypothetical protein